MNDDLSCDTYISIASSDGLGTLTSVEKHSD